MARLADVPKLLRSVGPLEFARRVWGQVSDDNLFTWAAALAYSWLFAIFPFLVFLLSLLPYLPGPTRAEAEKDIHHFLTRWLPQEASKTIRQNIEGNVNNLLHRPKGLLLYAGLLVALWAASSGMASTMSALDKCYELDRGRPFFVQRSLAVALTLTVILLLLIVAMLLPIGTGVRTWIVSRGLLGRNDRILILFDVARWALALVCMFTVLAVIYYKGPGVKHHFFWVTPGALFTVVVWVLLALGFRMYIDRFGSKGYDQMYGALGGVAILMLLFYIDALVLLIGAEINSEIDFEVLKVRRGTRDFRRAEDLGMAAPTAL